jgi:hypothetical protein
MSVIVIDSWSFKMTPNGWRLHAVPTEGGIDVKPLMCEVPKGFVHHEKPPADVAKALLACHRHERGRDFATSLKYTQVYYHFNSILDIQDS